MPRTWGWWTEQKLDMLSAYPSAFTNASKKAGGTVYLDLFAGAAENTSRATGEEIAGSPRRTLEARPPFTKVVLFELLPQAQALEVELRQRFPDRDLTVYAGDCNDTIGQALRDLQGLRWAPTFALIDQYAAEVRWSTIEQLARHKRADRPKVELWMLCAPAMVPRCLRRPHDALDQGFVDRVSAMYGTAEWLDLPCPFTGLADGLLSWVGVLGDTPGLLA